MKSSSIPMAIICRGIVKLVTNALSGAMSMIQHQYRHKPQSRPLLNWFVKKSTQRYPSINMYLIAEFDFYQPSTAAVIKVSPPITPVVKLVCKAIYTEVSKYII